MVSYFLLSLDVVGIIIIIIIRESGDPPSILSDTKAEDMYLELEQLGNFLKTLSGSLESVYYTSFLVDVTTKFCYSQVRYRRNVPFLLTISWKVEIPIY